MNLHENPHSECVQRLVGGFRYNGGMAMDLRANIYYKASVQRHNIIIDECIQNDLSRVDVLHQWL